MSKSDRTLFEAMELFHDLAQALVFSAKEIALFHALLYSWNAARRPAVIEQWADVTARNSGMERHAMARAREKLEAAGVIFFEKSGNRSTPRYSFHALFRLESPFLRVNNGTNNTVTCTLTARNMHVNRTSKQDKDKEEGEGEETHAHDSLEKISRRPLCTLSQAIANAPMCRMTQEQAEHWWHTRNASDWTKGSSGGGSPRKITSWQSDMATSVSWVADAMSKNQKSKQGGINGFGV
jgi:predicted transcriptional regulator